MRTMMRVDLGGDQSTSAAHYVAGEPRLASTLILGHGAGGHQGSPFIVQLAEGFSRAGVDVITFNFPYTERKKRVPDPAGVLEACCEAVMRHARSLEATAGNRLFTGGKSLGGRIASQAAARLGAAERTALAGLIFFGYPLHPPGRPDKLRTQHLPAVGVPMLFIQGTRDTFGSPEEVRAALREVKVEATIYEVAGADHSLAVRRSAAPAGATLDLVIDVAIGWMKSKLPAG